MARYFESMGYRVKIENIYNIRLVIPYIKPNFEYKRTIYLAPFQRIEIPHGFKLMDNPQYGRVIYYYVTEGIPLYIEFLKYRLKKQLIVTPSRFSKEMIESVGVSVREVIPHMATPLQVDHAFGRMWRSKYPSNKKIFVYVGNPARRKGLPELKKAVEVLSQRRKDFIVVVHTIEQPSLQGYSMRDIKHEHIVIEFEFGRVTKDKALAKVAYADIYVHPALSEGFGLPVLEAMQLQKPLVCINTYGVNEIATPESAFMVEPKEDGWITYPPSVNPLTKFKVKFYDPRDLADAMEEALTAPKHVIEDKLAKARERVKMFENTYRRFLEL